jgi:hypothetical protein
MSINLGLPRLSGTQIVGVGKGTFITEEDCSVILMLQNCNLSQRCDRVKTPVFKKLFHLASIETEPLLQIHKILYINILYTQVRDFYQIFKKI